MIQSPAFADGFRTTSAQVRMFPSEIPFYLDYNATTPLDRRVRDRIVPILTDIFGNPSSRDHALGWDAADAILEARLEVAELLGAYPSELVFTSGATESINQILKGLAGSSGDPVRFIAAPAEHDAVLATLEQLQMGQRATISSLPVERSGEFDLTPLTTSADAGRTLVALMLANNETGVLQPVREAARIAHDHGALFFCDLTAAAGKIPIDVRALGIDLAAFSAHKMYGPKGVGALYVRSGEPKIELEPLIVGGGQERGLRGGTLNVPGIVGFGEACRIARLEMHDEAQRIRHLRDHLENTLLGELPDLLVNGDRVNRLPNTTNIAFLGVDARTLIRDMHDIAVSTKSACSSGKPGPSHVLKAMGLSDDEAYSSIRFSLGRFTTPEEIDYTIHKVITSVRKLRALRSPSLP